jgi:hypothetical protein
VDRLEAPELALMRGIDAQKAAVVANVQRLASGAAAHDMLLWGSRGMGKSAVLRAAVKAADAARPGSIALVQAMPDATLPLLFGQLRGVDRASWCCSTISASMPAMLKARACCARGWKAAWKRARPMCVWPSRQTAAPSSSAT